MRYFLLAAILFLALMANGQIVNIEQQRIKADTTGWFGNADISFSLVKNDQQIASLGTDVHVQYVRPKSTWLELGSLNFLKSKNTNLVNDGFEHLRYNYKIKPWLRAEAFSQAQFNSIIKVKFRGLVGAGPRFQLVQKKKVWLALGTLYMYEYEEVSGEQATIHRDHRLSSYLSFSVFPGKVFSFTSTTYFQPKFTQFSDYRISTENRVNLKINKQLSATISFSLLHDSNPPQDVPQTIYEFKNGIAFSF